MATPLIEIQQFLTDRQSADKALEFIQLMILAIEGKEYEYARVQQILNEGQIDEDVIFDKKAMEKIDPTGKNELKRRLNKIKNALETNANDLAAVLILNVLNSDKVIGPTLIRLFVQGTPEQIV
ncbi:MAG: hypothetical protein HZA34_00055 [Candidatus Pacebacteria bacterium]|nr:hypothetical protein [Candidatus Paceibacterota bacterium]